MAVHIRRWDPGKIDSLRRETRAALREGGLVVFPTDTVYGIGGRYDLPATEGLLRVAKESGPERPFQILVSDEKAVERFIRKMPPIAQAFAEAHWPGPLTIVVESRKGDFVGLRRPAHEATVFVVECAGGALLASSANKAGQETARDAREAAEVFDDRIALAIDAGPASIGKASSVVKVTEEAWELLREAALSRKALTRTAGVAPTSGELR